MLNLTLGKSGPLSILCLGAHSDDIEIGAGATLLRLLAERPGSDVTWAVLSGKGTTREQEAKSSAQQFLQGAQARIEVLGFRDGFFPYDGVGVKEYFEALKPRVNPDLILTHTEHDRHQDHRVVSELTYNSFRDHLVLEYEIPKWDGDLITPNLYVPIASSDAERKVELLGRCFGSQRSKDWFSRETFLALMRLRGVECRSASGLAEGFHLRKATL